MTAEPFEPEALPPMGAASRGSFIPLAYALDPEIYEPIAGPTRAPEPWRLRTRSAITDSGARRSAQMLRDIADGRLDP